MQYCILQGFFFNEQTWYIDRFINLSVPLIVLSDCVGNICRISLKWFAVNVLR